MDGWKVFGLSVLMAMYTWMTYGFLYWLVGINTAMFCTVAPFVFSLVASIAICRMNKQEVKQ